MSKMADRCLSSTAIWYSSSALNIVTDFYIFSIPLPSILALTTQTLRQKVVLLLIFSLGFL